MNENEVESLKREVARLNKVIEFIFANSCPTCWNKPKWSAALKADAEMDDETREEHETEGWTK